VPFVKGKKDMEKEKILKKLDEKMLWFLNDALKHEGTDVEMVQFDLSIAVGIMQAADSLELFSTKEFFNINHTLCSTKLFWGK
jgi:hypothetical protein